MSLNYKIESKQDIVKLHKNNNNISKKNNLKR